VRLRASIRLDLSNHRRVRRAIREGSGPVEQVLDEYERLYRAFILGRFDRYSVGGGNWPKLKPAYARQKKKNKDKILVHSRFMRLKLQTGIKILAQNRNSIRLGFDMGMNHPDAGITVGQLAEIHDQGLGVPKRQILVLPDDKTAKEMRDAGTGILAKEMRGER
jgi:hypothetical protein